MWADVVEVRVAGWVGLVELMGIGDGGVWWWYVVVGLGEARWGGCGVLEGVMGVLKGWVVVLGLLVLLVVCCGGGFCCGWVWDWGVVVVWGGFVGVVGLYDSVECGVVLGD